MPAAAAKKDMQTPAWLNDYQLRIEQQLEGFLPTATTQPEALHQAMRYACLNGGKRIRGVLAYATGQALGIGLEHLDGAAAAVEFIHAYSLIHDDLPAMDNDALRRGKPTCHIAYGEATALLAGDALQTLAFAALADLHHPGLGVQQRLWQIQALAAASGSLGMAGGQAIDLEGTGRGMSLQQLETMHGLKTGALIRASVKLAALAAYAPDHDIVARLDTYACNIGLAFQIQDDILDVEGDTATLGKVPGADQALGKSTYPALMGLEAAKQRARQLHQDALAQLRDIPGDTTQLAWMANYIILRKS